MLTLGNTATRSVLSTSEAISSLRGRVVHHDGLNVLPTFHPAAALRGGPNVVAMMRADLRAAARFLESGS